MMVGTSVLLGAGLLVAAGAYQLSPLKHACSRHCRSPLFFISHHWRPGKLGALRMGLEHGAFCTGCCWFLMALLFYGGIMNLYWIVGLAVFVLLEKTIPAGHWLARTTGALLIAWGGALVMAIEAPDLQGRARISASIPHTPRRARRPHSVETTGANPTSVNWTKTRSVDGARTSQDHIRG